MEQEIKLNEDNENNLNCFKLEYKGQNVENIPQFQKWYEDTNKRIQKQNLESKRNYLRNDFCDTVLLIISFCPYCDSYSVCSYDDGYCFIKCENCKTEFCIGCYFKKNFKYNYNQTICLKGYFKLLFLRTIYRRSELCVGKPIFYLMHIGLNLILTPPFFGFVYSFLGCIPHKKSKINQTQNNNLNENNDDDTKIKLIYMLIYSFLRAILMFPYIIISFPFMVLLLIPGIFSKKYYFTVFVFYITSIEPGGGYLDNDVMD